MFKDKVITIATPMYGGVCTGHYVQGLIRSIIKLGSFGIKVNWLRVMNESLITRARNELTRIFLESNSQYLMFIDGDISFDDNAILTLLKADRDISCATYPAKQINWSQIEKAAEKSKTKLKNYAGLYVMHVVDKEKNFKPDQDGMLEIDHGGTGFMMIKRNVFEKLSNHVPEYRRSNTKDSTTKEFIEPITKEFFATSIKDNLLLSEDYHFCELWKKQGGKIFINPFIKLQHIGSYEFDGDIIESSSLYKK